MKVRKRAGSFSGTYASTVVAGGLALACAVPRAAAAQGVNSTPDAQVEANVLKALAGGVGVVDAGHSVFYCLWRCDTERNGADRGAAHAGGEPDGSCNRGEEGCG